MSRFEPGLLEKLFGDGPHQPAPAMVRQLSLDELKGSVAHHIESLLNARVTFTDERLAGFSECQRSVLTYGLNDFAGLSLASHDDRTTICNSIRRAIERHERRLKQVEVILEVNARSTHIEQLVQSVGLLDARVGKKLEDDYPHSIAAVFDLMHPH